MTPDPGADTIKTRKINSSTRLLAATCAFKVLNRFGGGMQTQRKIQEAYDMCKSQQLAALYHRQKGTWREMHRRSLNVKLWRAIRGQEEKTLAHSKMPATVSEDYHWYHQHCYATLGHGNGNSYNSARMPPLPTTSHHPWKKWHLTLIIIII